MKRKRNALEEVDNPPSKKRKNEENKQDKQEDSNKANKANEYHEKAKILLKKDEKDEKALKLLCMCLENDCDNIEALYLRSYIYFSKKNYSGSKTDIVKSMILVLEQLNKFEISKFNLNEILITSKKLITYYQLFTKLNEKQEYVDEKEEEDDILKTILLETDILVVIDFICLPLLKKSENEDQLYMWVLIKNRIVFSRGKGYFFRNEFDKALNDFSICEKFYEQPEKLGSNNSRIVMLNKIYYFKGNSYFNKKKARLSIMNFEKCLKIYKDHSKLFNTENKKFSLLFIHYYIAYCLCIRLNQNFEAIKVIENAKKYFEGVENDYIHQEYRWKCINLRKVCVERLKSKIFMKNVEKF